MSKVVALLALASCIGFAAAQSSSCSGVQCSANNERDARAILEGAVCRPTCEQIHLTSAPCDLDPECEWSVSDKMCYTRCEYIKREEHCVVNSTWRSTYRTAGRIWNSSRHCFWDKSNAKCFTRCHHFGLAQCPNSSLCMPFENRACLHRCSDIDSRSDFADADLTQLPAIQYIDNITFDGVSEADRRALCRVMYKGECAFNNLRHSCLPSCNAKHRTNMTSCRLDSECVHINTTMFSQRCAEACNLFPTKDLCGVNESTHCFWDPYRKSCDLRCDLMFHVDNISTCATHPRCNVFGSQLFSTEFAPTYCPPGSPPGLSCTMLQQSTNCRQNCSAFDGSSSECRNYWPTGATGYLCDYVDIQGYALCVPNCQNADTESKCSPMTYCRWSARQQKCMRRCESVSNTSCTSYPTCRVSSSLSCVTECAEAAFSQTLPAFQGACSGLSRCSLSTANECLDQCSSLGAASCESEMRCVLLNGVCSTSCTFDASLQTSESACTARSSCQWTNQAGCFDRCTLLRSSRCLHAGNPMCMSHPSDSSKCITQCSLLSASQCPTDSDCELTNAGLECHVKCKYFSSGTCGLWESNRGCILANTSIPGNMTCTLRCSYRYANDATSCDADPNCEYFAGNGCQQNCGTLTNVNHTSLCNSMPGCLWRLGACRARCEEKYRSQGSCDADSTCLWTGGQCVARCSAHTNNTECETQTTNCGWVWNSDGTGTCEPLCRIRYLTQSACDASSICQWAPHGCATRCQALNVTLCGLTRFSSGCIKDNGACYSPCDDRASMSSCNADSRCNWFDRLNVCRATCNGLSIENCRLQYPICNWHGYARKCYGSCDDLAASNTTCAAQQHCNWYETSKRCTPRCTTLSFQQCAVEDSCMWDSPTSSCFTKNCTYRDATVCAIDSLCAWDTPTQTCFPACSTFNTSVCALYTPYCNWNYHNVTCELGCSYAFTNTSIMNATERANWTAYLANTSALTHNLNLTDIEVRLAQACNANWRCSYNLVGNFACNTACQALPVSTCTTVNHCFWTSLTGCQNYVTVSPTFRSCTSASATRDECVKSNVCLWLNGTSRCSPRCAKYNGITHYGQCANDAFCTPASLTECVESCSTITDSFMCTNNTRCEWTGSLCRIRCLSFPTCGNTTEFSHCFYNKSISSCDTGCVGRFTNQASCDNHNGCEWIARSGVCGRKCDGLDAFECNSENFCYWNSGLSRCFAKCFNKHQSASACFNDTTCYWNPISSRCAMRCENWNATECAYDSLCSAQPFGVNNSLTCQRLCSTVGFSTLQQTTYCAAQNCEWVRYSVVPCLYNCSLMNEALCTSTYYCQYNTQTRTCERNCQYRFDNFTHMQQQCATQPNCEAYPLSNFCYQTCEQRTTTTCLAYNFACELNGAQCHTMCSRLSSQSACTANSFCTWSSGELCSDCSLRTTSTLCLASTRCGYAGQWAGTCYDVCEYATSQSGCNAIAATSGCVFSNSQCTTVCSMLTFSVCSRTPRCRLNTAKGRCEEACSVKYSTQAACDADGDCQSFPSSTLSFGFCGEKCARLSFTDCRANSNCVYSRAQGRCETSCSRLYFPVSKNTTDPALCAADSRCVLIATAGVQVCAQNCNRFSYLSTDCAAQYYCFWSDTNQRCENRCLYRRSAPAFYDANYTYNNSITYPVPTPTMNQQMNQAAASYSSFVSNCNSDKYCVTDYSLNSSFFPTCTEDCTLFTTEATCPTLAQCRWLGDLLGCQQSCVSQFGRNDTLCVTNPRCEFDFTTYRCKEKCIAFDTQVTCETQTSHCVWKRNRCLVGCATAYAQNTSHDCSISDATCDARPSASLATRCTERCELFDTQTRCQSRGVGCFWQLGFNPNITGQCARTCSQFTIEDECVGDASCEWRGEAPFPSCTQKCTRYTSELTCNNVIAAGEFPCEWAQATKQCLIRCTTRFQSKNDTYPCESYSHCQLLGQGTGADRCNLKCSERTDKTKCTAETDCRWNTRLGVCHQRCTREFNHSRALCEASPNCRWFTYLNQCDDNCANELARTTCDVTSVNLLTSAPRCQWSINDGCEMRCEDRTDNATLCDADPECIWSNVLKRCTTQCNAQTSYWTCEAFSQPTCAWIASFATGVITFEYQKEYNKTAIGEAVSNWFDVHYDNVTVTAPFRACNRTYVEASVVSDFDRIHNMTASIEYWSKDSVYTASLNLYGVYNIRVGRATVPSDVKIGSGAVSPAVSFAAVLVAAVLLLVGA